MKRHVAVLYVNGLGTGKISWQERLVQTHWQKAGVHFQFAEVNWYNGEQFAIKVSQVEKMLVQLLVRYEKVILLGSSAGGSLALSVFARSNDNRIWFINAHGRLRRGNIHWPDYRTLEWAAHLDSKRSSQTFYASVLQAERGVIPHLKTRSLSRILILKPIIDFVVPIKAMDIPLAKTRRTFAIGHKWAAISHLIFCRNLILRFTSIQ